MTCLQMELPDELAWSFAQFLKRAGYSDYRALAIDEKDTLRDQNGVEIHQVE